MEVLSGTVLWVIVFLLVAYFLLVTWIGRKGVRFSKSMNGFATARGSVHPWIVGASFAATYASANLFIGIPGLAYQYGTSVLWYTLGCFGVSWIGLLLFAKTFWRYGKQFGRVSTLPEWLGKRYNSKTLQVLVSLLVLFNVYYIVGQNVGLATIFGTVIGIPYVWGIIIAVVITILYIGLGGAYAQLITDGLQGIMMAVTSVFILLSLLWTIGGGFHVFGTLNDKLASIDPGLTAPIASVGPYNSALAIAAVQFLLFGFVLMPHLLNKILSLETEEQLRPFTISSGVFLCLVSTLTVIGGLAARVVFPALENADQAIPAYLFEAFPPVVAAFFIVGIISAVLSSTDSLYLGIISSIGNDLYRTIAASISKRAWNDPVYDDRSVKVAKGSLFVVGFLTLYFSLQRPESLSLLIQFSFSAIISGIFAPITLGYLWNRSNSIGAIASVITGTSLYVGFTSSAIIDNIYLAMFASSAAGFAVMVGAGLLFAQDERQKQIFLLKKSV
ncbi:MAG TPA: sodium:solute symporter family protein [Bacillales bacterium]|nr:sodium:solute symporter family protein [Bacillales bacterium]